MEMGMRNFANKIISSPGTSDCDVHVYDEFKNQEENQRTTNPGTSQNSGPVSASRPYTLTAIVLLLLLCVLLSGITVLWIKYNNLTTENNQLQTSYQNLTAKRNQLQTSYQNLTAERNQLQTSYQNLTAERNQLQTSYQNMTAERNQLQTSYQNMTAERNQLQASYQNLTAERNQLQACYQNLTAERNQLQTSYQNLTAERNQLQTRYDTMRNQTAQEKDDLQKNLTIFMGYMRNVRRIIFNSSYYILYTQNLGWNESRQACKGLGADLLIINSQEEQDFITNWRGKKATWIGLSDGETEGQWKWVDGSLLTTGYWDSNQPGGGTKENCVLHEKKWHDYPCSDRYYSMCEMKI